MWSLEGGAEIKKKKTQKKNKKKKNKTVVENGLTKARQQKQEFCFPMHFQ